MTRSKFRGHRTAIERSTRGQDCLFTKFRGNFSFETRAVSLVQTSVKWIWRVASEWNHNRVISLRVRRPSWPRMPRVLLTVLPEECWETVTAKFPMQTLSQINTSKGTDSKSVTWFLVAILMSLTVSPQYIEY